MDKVRTQKGSGSKLGEISGPFYGGSGTTGSGGEVAVTGSTANTGSGTAKTIDTVPAYEKVMFIIKT